MRADREYWTKYDWLHDHALFTPVRRRPVEASHAAWQQAARSEEAMVEESNSKTRSVTSAGWEDATSFGLTFNNSDCSRSWSFLNREKRAIQQNHLGPQNRRRVKEGGHSVY